MVCGGVFMVSKPGIEALAALKKIIDEKTPRRPTN
jgi:hypothetical protein